MIHLCKIVNTGHDNDMWLTSYCTKDLHTDIFRAGRRGVQPRGAPESLAIALCRHRVPRITAGSLLAAAETAWAAAFHVQFHHGAVDPSVRARSASDLSLSDRASHQSRQRSRSNCNWCGRSWRGVPEHNGIQLSWFLMQETISVS